VRKPVASTTANSPPCARMLRDAIIAVGSDALEGVLKGARLLESEAAKKP